MKTGARWANVLLLPVIALIGAGAWYAARTGLVPLMLEGGASYADVAPAYTAMTVAGILGALLAGGLAIAVTPWGTLGAGVAAFGVGLLLTGLAPAEATGWAMVVAAFGRGMMTPSTWGALARAIDGPRAGLRDAAFLMTYVLVNIGALGTMAVSEVETDAMRAVLGVGAVASLFAFALAAVAAAVTYKLRDPDAPKAKPRAAHLGLVVAIVVVVSVPTALSFVGGQLVFPMLSTLEDREWIFSVNPAVVIVTGGLLALGLAGLHLAKLRVPALLFVGIGLLIGGAAVLGLLLTEEPAVPLLVGLLAIGAIGEVLVGPLVLSRITADLPFRLGTLAAALWGVAVQLPGFLPNLLGEQATRPLAWGAVVLGVLVGLVLVAIAFPTRRVFAPPSDEPEEARPAEF